MDAESVIYKSIWGAVIVTLDHVEFDVEVWDNEPFLYQDYLTGWNEHRRFELLHADYDEKIAYYG